MEARRLVEFTGVEKAAIGPLEKAATDLARAVTTMVEKVVRALEKATAEMEEGGRPRSGPMEMQSGGHSNVMENTEAARRSAATALWNGSVQVLEVFLRTEAFEC